MKFSKRNTRSTSRTAKPTVLVGAGPLISPVWKSGNEKTGFRYRFEIFRSLRKNSRGSTVLHPLDLLNLVKLIQVLAAVIADDGCITPTERMVLKRLASKLDQSFGGEVENEFAIE
jgi:hypothetical protein